MKNFWNNLGKWQKISVILVPLVVALFVAIMIAINIVSEPKVKINFVEKNSIPSNEMMNIRKRMAGVIETNTEDYSDSVVYYGDARDYQEDISDNITTATFIVDFDEIKESYFVTVWWPNLDDDMPNVSISCPIYDSKYPETPCITETNSSLDLVSFLPYTGTLETGEKYEVTAEYNTGDLYLNIKVDACGSLEIVDAAFDAVKRWMTSLNFNPNEYLFYVPTGACDNGTGNGLGYYYAQVNHANTNDANVNAALPYFMPGAFKVYPVVDENNNVTSINAEYVGCTDYQTDPAEDNVTNYLKSKGISYPVNSEYCVE